MRVVRCAISIMLCATSVGACTSIAPKNPVKAAAVCGYAQDPTGARIPDFNLRLLREDQSLEVQTDASGDFKFPPMSKGMYVMSTKSGGWQLGAPLKITGSKAVGTCVHPLVVQPSIGGCGGGISKKGYHPRY